MNSKGAATPQYYRGVDLLPKTDNEKKKFVQTEAINSAQQNIGKAIKWAEDLKHKQKIKQLSKDQERLATIAKRSQELEETQIQLIQEKLSTVQLPAKQVQEPISPSRTWVSKNKKPEPVPVEKPKPMTAHEREQSALKLAQRLKANEDNQNKFSESEFLAKNKPKTAEKEDWMQQIKEKKQQKKYYKDKNKLERIAAKRQAEEQAGIGVIEAYGQVSPLREVDDDSDVDSSLTPTESAQPTADSVTSPVVEEPPVVDSTLTRPADVQAIPQPVFTAPEATTKEMARTALIAAKKKAAESGVPFDETEFIIQLVESKRKEYELAKQKIQQASILKFFQQIDPSGAPPEAVPEPALVAAASPVPPTSNAKTTAFGSLKKKPTSLSNTPSKAEENTPPPPPAHILPKDKEAASVVVEPSPVAITFPSSTDKFSISESTAESIKAEFVGLKDDDLLSPEIKQRVRLALKAAKDKAVRAGLPFDDATAIVIAQDLLSRAAKASRPVPQDLDAPTANGETFAERINKALMPPTSKAAKAGDVDEEEVRKDQLKLAIIAAKKKAMEAGEEFDESIFIAVYERKRSHLLAKNNKERSQKFPMTLSAQENNTELEAVLRDQAKVAARAAKQQAALHGEYFDEVDFTVRFIINRRKELGGKN